MSAPFSLTESVRDGLAHLTLTGHVDLATRRPVCTRVRHHLARTAVTGVVVDLAAATGIDPSGVGILLSCRRHALDVHKTFRVDNASESVTHILAPTGVMMLLAGATATAYLAEAVTDDQPDGEPR